MVSAKRFKFGFTLIELLLVIAILGIIAAAVLVAINPAKRSAQARDATRKTSLAQIASALVYYYTEHAAYPDPTLSGDHSSDSTSNGYSGYWIPGLVPDYLKRLPKDPAQASLITNSKLASVGRQSGKTIGAVLGTATGARGAGAGANNNCAGVSAWTSTGNVTASDDLRALANVVSGTTLDSQCLFVTNFGFSTADFPSGSTITGIRVGIEESEGSGDDNVLDTSLYLLKSGAIVGNNKALASEWPTSTAEATVFYGADGDLWGTSWSSADIFDPGFGVSVRAGTTTNGSGQANARVDYVTMTVYYDAPVPSPTPTPSPSASPSPTPSPGSSPLPAGKYYYLVASDLQSFQLWASLEDTADPQTYNGSRAVCTLAPPDAIYNYCVKN